MSSSYLSQKERKKKKKEEEEKKRKDFLAKIERNFVDPKLKGSYPQKTVSQL
jgi:ribosome maturation protein Sdo1